MNMVDILKSIRDYNVKRIETRKEIEAREEIILYLSETGQNEFIEEETKRLNDLHCFEETLSDSIRQLNSELFYIANKSVRQLHVV